MYSAFSASAPGNLRTFAEFRSRDTCIVADPATGEYCAVGPGRTQGSDQRSRRPAIVVYTSKDLRHWSGPRTLFTPEPTFWGATPIRGIWAPEMHHYRGKWYLFATFDTEEQLAEQWRDWLPRVRRGTQILVGDSPHGPFRPFAPTATLPADMMTLDGTLWVEDDVPYMVFCHEWVQIKNGTVCFVRLKPDLSATDGEPVRLFEGSDAPWAVKSAQWGCHVTDGPSLVRSKSGKLFLAWSGFGAEGYTTGVAISDSGKLAGPWRQAPEPLFADDGGHPFLFRRHDGQLMLALHSPNKTPNERVHLFEVEDTGETLRIIQPFSRPPR